MPVATGIVRRALVTAMGGSGPYARREPRRGNGGLRETLSTVEGTCRGCFGKNLRIREKYPELLA